MTALAYRLREDEFDRLITDRGWLNDHQAARGIGVSHTTIGRIRKRELNPGLHFIGTVTAALGVNIEDLFDRVEPAAASSAGAS